MAKLAATTYDGLIRFVGYRNSRTIGNNTTAYVDDDGDITIRLHGHPIVLMYATGEILIALAEYPTVTTRERINQFLPAGHRVYQRNHQQFLDGRPIDSSTWYMVDAG
jgi:hypothetical protein